MWQLSNIIAFNFTQKMEKEIYISKDGLTKLKAELHLLETIKLREIAKKIAEARDLGDLAENSEYQEAKERQSFLYGRAQELKYKIKNAIIIEDCSSGEEISVGCKVILQNGDTKMDFELVGSEESDPVNGKISVDSPIGQALVGHKSGDKVTVTTPAGENQYRVTKK